MSSPTTPSKGTFQEAVDFALRHAVLPVTAMVSVVPIFRDLMIKSAQQKGLPLPKVTFFTGLKEGCIAAPPVGLTIGCQMMLQPVVEDKLKKYMGESKDSPLLIITSSGFVGAVTSPFEATFNGRTISQGYWQAFKNVTLKQCSVIAAQEAAFVAGLRTADYLATTYIRTSSSSRKGTEYVISFSAGAVGSLVGHPANTALTLWQSNLPVKSLRQLMKGAPRKAWAIGKFAVFYKFTRELCAPDVKSSKD